MNKSMNKHDSLVLIENNFHNNYAKTNFPNGLRNGNVADELGLISLSVLFVTHSIIYACEMVAYQYGYIIV